MSFWLILLLTPVILGAGAASGVQPPGMVAPDSPPSAPQVADPGINPTRVIGEVTEIDRRANRILVKTEAGNTVIVLLDENTDYLRVPPGEMSLDKAVNVPLDEIGPGDKVYARGRLSEDRKSLPAQKIVVMLKAEIEKDRQRQRQEWQARGIVGVVTALNPATWEITLQVRDREGPRTLTVATAQTVQFRRYAPDSVKFSDAKPSSFAELRVNDQLRALGEKSANGTRFVAEQIVSGSFRTVTGTVSAVNAETGEIRISALGKKQSLTVVVSKDSLLRRITPQMGVAIAAAMPRPRKETREGSPATQPPQNAGAAGGDELQRALERLAPLGLADIKPGDVLVVTSTEGADPSRLTAVTLISGVDHILNALQSAEGPRNSLSLDMGLPAGLFDSGTLRP